MATERGKESLEQFRIAGVRDTGITVGDGSYATVRELNFHGLKCVGKKIHGILYDSARPHEKAHMLERFAIECELLSRLHHPSIVQFLGIYFESGSQMPVMVMEFLHTTLSNLIDDYGILPEEISYDVFRDVALGLRYLHERSPCIVHRDLSANNVLMSKEMNAKISDLGVAKILNLRPSQMTQTQTPGTPAYMPPEAMVARPKYTSKVDIFSYGVMMVHVLSGQWPIPGSVFRVDPTNPGVMIPLSEIERRAENFQAIRPDHPLMDLIRLCLSNSPDPRPDAVEILCQVNTVGAELPPTFRNKLEMIQQFRSRAREVAELRRDNESLRSEIDSKTREIETKRRESSEKTRENETLRRELDAQRQETATKTRDNEARWWEIKQQRSEVNSVRRENQLLREQLEKQRIPLPKPATTEPQPQIHLARIQWKRVADLPVAMDSAKSALVRGRVYIGGGATDSDSIYDYFRMFGYDPEKDRWTTLPFCPVMFFAMGEFRGELITVGGHGGEGITGNVHRFNELSQQWELHLQPMPTARSCLSIITSESAIAACGGCPVEIRKPCATVEVYTAITGQWHAADPLLFPSFFMTTSRIGDIGYLLGGSADYKKYTKAVLYIPLASLVEKAASVSTCVQQLPRSPEDSLWKTLTPTTLLRSSAVSLGGHLLAVAGIDDRNQIFPAVYVFLPSTNTWERMLSGDLPELIHTTCAVQLSDSQILVCGGKDSNNKKTRSVYMGNITNK